MPGELSVCPGSPSPRRHGQTDNSAVAAVRRAVRRGIFDLTRAELVLAAVSGGPDSLALAAALAREAPALGLRAGSVTVDHGLQDDSLDRAMAAAEQCRRLGLDPVVVERVTVAGPGGLEAAARDARYAALERALDREQGAVVALGHTLDDHAETVLLGLARGSGARSLAGIPAVRGRFRRPLLGLRRRVTEGACAELGIEAWHDPHNGDPAFARVRVRGSALPALEAALGPGTVEALARSADLLRADADALDGWAAAVLADVDRHSRGLEVAALAALPAAVRTRVIRRAAIAAGAPAGALTAAHVASVDVLVTAWRGQGPVTLPGGLEASRSYDRLLFR